MSIPVMKIFTESFKHVWNNKLAWTKLAFAPFVIYVASMLIFPTLVNYFYPFTGEIDAATYGIRLQLINSVVTGFASLIAIIILYINAYRYGILNEEKNSWWQMQLNMRLVKLILYNFLLLLILAVFGIIGVYIIGSGLSTLIKWIASSLLTIIGFYILFRLGLISALVSIEKEKALRTSWTMMKGNVFRFGVVFFLINLVMVLPGMAYGFVEKIVDLSLMTSSSKLGIIINLFFKIPFSAILILINTAVLAKGISLFYLYITEKKA